MLIAEKGGDFVTIEEYIKSKPKFELMPFVTVYATIMELINDGFIEQSAFEKGGGSDVAVHKFEPQKQVSGTVQCGRFPQQPITAGWKHILISVCLAY